MGLDIINPAIIIYGGQLSAVINFRSCWTATTTTTMRPLQLICCSALLSTSYAVTVYRQKGQSVLGTATSAASAADYTGSAAYNPTVLIAPAPPEPRPPLQFSIGLPDASTLNLSIPQSGYFMGFSVEMSVVNQVCECASIAVLVAPDRCTRSRKECVRDLRPGVRSGLTLG